MKIMMRVCLCLLCLLVTGCLALPIHEYNTDFAHIMPLRKLNLPKLSVVSAPDKDADVDSIMVRYTKFDSPEISFDEYLKEAIRNELIDLRIYDEKSSKTITTTLLKNEVSAPQVWLGHIDIEARFVVANGNRTLYNKVQTVHQDLGWNFYVAEAHAAVLKSLPSSYHQLLDVLYADPEFIAALKGEGA